MSKNKAIPNNEYWEHFSKDYLQRFFFKACHNYICLAQSEVPVINLDNRPNKHCEYFFRSRETELISVSMVRCSCHRQSGCTAFTTAYGTEVATGKKIQGLTLGSIQHTVLTTMNLPKRASKSNEYTVYKGPMESQYERRHSAHVAAFRRMLV